LIGAAEKAGAKVVVYAPLSSETVNLPPIFSSKETLSRQKIGTRPQRLRTNRPRFRPIEPKRGRRIKKLRAGKEKKETPENCLERWKPPALQEYKFVGRWNLVNSIRSAITPINRSSEFTEQASVQSRTQPAQLKTVSSMKFGNPERRRNQRCDARLLQREAKFVRHAFRWRTA